LGTLHDKCEFFVDWEIAVLAKTFYGEGRAGIAVCDYYTVFEYGI
jgi:hypothetical protein